MNQPRLPDGFAVQVDRRVRVLGKGAALLGGSPTRLLRLAPAAQTMIDGGIGTSPSSFRCATTYLV